MLSITGLGTGSFILGSVPTIGCLATDERSGLDGACSTSVTGGTASGVGTFNVSATVKDKAGNVTSTSGTYKVIYRFEGFLQPINDTAHQTCAGCPSSIFKGGSTVPAKFRLRDSAGNPVQSASVPQWLTPVQGGMTTAPVDESTLNDPATSGSTYRWDSTAQQYIYNWSTKSPYRVGYYYRVGVKLDDGSTYTVDIGLR